MNPTLLLTQVALVTLIGAVILRAAVALYAKIFSSSARRSSPSLTASAQQPHGTEPSSNSPYATPMATSNSYSDQVKLQGFPSDLPFLRACAIALVVILAGKVIEFGVGSAAGAIFQPQSMDELGRMIPFMYLAIIGISFFTTSGIFMGMLSIPKFSTAMIITLLFYLITIAVVIAIFLVAMAIASGIQL